MISVETSNPRRNQARCQTCQAKRQMMVGPLRLFVLAIGLTAPIPIQAWWSSKNKKNHHHHHHNTKSDSGESRQKEFFSSNCLRFLGGHANDDKNHKGNHSKSSSSSSIGRRSTPWYHHFSSMVMDQLPRIRCQFQPTTSIKIKKHFHWKEYQFWIGADYQVSENVWKIQTSGDAAWLGSSTVLFTGRELQFIKHWNVMVLPDIVTCLKLRTGIDITNGHASIRLGFGPSSTMMMNPINLQKGITIRHQFPLDQPILQTTTTNSNMNNTNHDNNKSRVKLEVRASLALPETALEFNTQRPQSKAEMSDIHMALEEVNLILDY